MKFILWLLLLFNFGIFCHGRYEPRILHGSPVPLGEYMNVLRIHGMENLLQFHLNASFAGQFPSIVLETCTGTVISDRHILTAAHCVLSSLTKTKLYPGFLLDYRPVDPNLQSMKAVLNVSEHALITVAYPHKGYEWQHFQHDIAIVEVPEGTNLGEPVVLAKNYEEGENDIGESVGYGDIDPTETLFPAKVLNHVEAPILPKAECKGNDATHPVICAGNSTHRTDHGDSGGPLFIKKEGQLYQIGICHDGGNKDGTPNQVNPDFGVYMRLSAYCEWIETTTKGKAKCEDIRPSSGAPSTPESPATPTPAPQTGETTPNGGNGYNAILKNTFIILFSILIANVLNIALFF